MQNYPVRPAHTTGSGLLGILDVRRLGRNVSLAPKLRTTAKGDAERQTRRQNEKSCFSNLRVPSFFSEEYAPVVTRYRIHDWIHDWNVHFTTGGSCRLISHRGGVDDVASTMSPIGPIGPVGPIGPIGPTGPIGPIGSIGPIGTIGPITSKI